MNKLPEILFGILICLAVVVVVLGAMESAPGDHGFDHPDYPKNTIQQARERGEAQQWITVAASCFGGLTWLFVVGGLALGLSPQRQSGFAPRLLTVAAVIFAGLFLLVVFLASATDSSTARLWGLPLSTAIMLVVLAPSPLVLVLLYLVAFRRWILPPEDEARFHRLVAQRRAEKNH